MLNTRFFFRASLAIVTGSLLGAWVVWQDCRDAYLMATMECAISKANTHPEVYPSVEFAYRACED